jgi:hypothetical protein
VNREISKCEFAQSKQIFLLIKILKNEPSNTSKQVKKFSYYPSDEKAINELVFQQIYRYLQLIGQ